ncbi:MAG TPA: zeta toxin family protein [Thermoanaerobaculia bacterium]
MKPVLFVLAGVNGAGKSSVGGATLRSRSLDYFNPDEAASRIRAVLGCPVEEANARAWNEGRLLLENAIRERTSHAFETTLGGRTIARLIAQAALTGFDVRMWYVGVATVEQHIARVRARVAAGGHDIPEEKIRERWDGARRNLIALKAYLTELRLFDNSAERAVGGKIPAPTLLLHWDRGSVIYPSATAVEQLEATPEWAKPIVAAALQLARGDDRER